MCGASPLNLPPDAAGYLISHNIAPAAVKSRLEELATVPKIVASHDFTARLPELMDIALRFDENRPQGIAALLCMVLEDSQPVIYTNLPTGPAVRRGPSLVNTTRSFRP